MRVERIAHVFVDEIPESLDEGVLYIAIEYGTATHRCYCGCGNEVVTPITPNDWSLIYDGETVSLHPSVGNWSFDCRSHYWIRKGVVRWALPWSDEEIAENRERDMHRKRRFFAFRGTANEETD